MNTSVYDAKKALKEADGIIIGASNGLSISEGYNIFADNDMFRSQFGDFRQKYGLRNVLDGIFAKHMSQTDYQEYMNRLVKLWVDEYEPSEVMNNLRAIVGEKPYFILTTNADEHLEKAGFDSDKVWEIEGTFRSTANGVPINRRKSLDEFIDSMEGKRLVILELGIGSRNRLIKLPLMQLTASRPETTYITLNLAHEIYVAKEIEAKSIALPGDIASTLAELKHV